MRVHVLIAGGAVALGSRDPPKRSPAVDITGNIGSIVAEDIADTGKCHEEAPAAPNESFVGAPSTLPPSQARVSM